MKVVSGLAEGRQALARDSFNETQGQSPEILAGIRRIFGSDLTVEEAVGRILKDVSNNGDLAVRDYSSRIDGTDSDILSLGRDEIRILAQDVPRDMIDALRRTAGRVREFHVASSPRPWIDMEKGFGEIIVPMERVGIYVPGGSASYPSTVLMTAIPARVAGVKEIIIATPPSIGGSPNLDVLAAAALADVDRLFFIGGAQAVGAMAYGTESVPRVDMICGPGNIFVTTAKRMVYGQVGIDGLEGPTETLIIADDTARPDFCAADMLGQAEHDLLATPVLVTTSKELANSVQTQIVKQLQSLGRKDTATKALERRGVIVTLDTLDEALTLANEYAPEHLCLMVKEPWASLGKIRNAGGIFLGEYSPEVMGDYIAGPSHVMPTGGTARFSSSLGIAQFVKRVPLVALDMPTTLRFANTAAMLARAEGLDAHARSAEIRTEIQSEGH